MSSSESDLPPFDLSQLTRALGFMAIEADRAHGFWRRRKLRREVSAFAGIVNAVAKATRDPHV